MRRIIMVVAMLALLVVMALPAMAQGGYYGNDRGDDNMYYGGNYGGYDRDNRDYDRDNRDYDRDNGDYNYGGGGGRYYQQPSCDWYWSFWYGWQDWCWSPYYGWYVER